jgi:hypothetical protein
MGTGPQDAIAPIPREALVGGRAFAPRAPVDFDSALHEPRFSVAWATAA